MSLTAPHSLSHCSVASSLCHPNLPQEGHRDSHSPAKSSISSRALCVPREHLILMTTTSPPPHSKSLVPQPPDPVCSRVFCPFLSRFTHSYAFPLNNHLWSSYSELNVAGI